MGEIDINVFLEIREKCNIPLEHIQCKADTLLKTYACFQESNDTHILVHPNTHTHIRKNADYEKKWGSKIIKKNIDRPKIGAGNREISKDDHIKRDFMSFINKLSDNNLKNVATYFENTFQIDFIDVYIKLLWEAILRSEEYQYLYVECLNTIFTITLNLQKQNIFLEKIYNIWTEYYNNTRWLPSEELINEEDYDDFCEFVKWKKTSMTYIHGFSKFINQEWVSHSIYSILLNELLQSLNIYLNKNPQGCKVTDALLDQINVLIKYIKINYNEDIYNFIEDLNKNSSQYRPSTRFKVYDMIEYIHVNSYINV